MHVVAFDNPYPPDYGGAMDMFYKLEALAEAGVEIHLHVFAYGRNDMAPLRRFASRIYTYERRKRWRDWVRRMPFIVATRRPDALLKNLMRDDLPVLFEGIHTTAWARELGQRPLFLRAHNVEHAYYRHLAETERRPWKKVFFYSEAKKLAAYERERFGLFRRVFAVHPADGEAVAQAGGRAVWVPVFHPFREVTAPADTEPFVLFHGNLSVPDNERAVIFLWRRVMKGLPYRFVAAGKNPPPHLRRMAEREGFEVAANPSEEQMRRLIRRARVQLMWTFGRTGMKLKLLHGLFAGNHIVANPLMTEGTGTEELVHVAANADVMRERVRELMRIPALSAGEIRKRREVLAELYDNRKNAQRMLADIF